MMRDRLREEFSAGKWLGRIVYLHISCQDELPEGWKDEVLKACEIAGVELGNPWNVIKINLPERRISLLHYDAFFSDPFPTLRTAYSVDLSTGVGRQRDYSASSNPPILHRKELLLPPEDGQRVKFAKLTAELEQRGMYRNAHQIGFREQWAARLSEAGLKIHDHLVVEMLCSRDLGDELPW